MTTTTATRTRAKAPQAECGRTHTTLRFRNDLMAAIGRLAKREGVSRNSLMERVLQEYCVKADRRLAKQDAARALKLEVFE